ncbi:MAG: phosphotransferase [Actinomycetales bacterium]|nr:phosphotransferase [Actinomycetales bacterium]
MVPADAPDPRAVLAAFGLPGEPVAVTEVEGAWSNRVLRLRTTEGDYAVKELRNAWGEPRWREWLDEGWRLELAALEAGVAVPEPVRTADGGCLAHVPRSDRSRDVPVRVHRWVESAQVPREPVDRGVARWVGRTLARVHGLALRPGVPGLYAGRLGLTTAEVWPDLVGRSAAAGAPWTSALARAEPTARRATALLVPWDGADELLCHGDVDQKNLLLAPDGPRLCDWDVVLPRLPAHDLAEAALTMASWRVPAVAASVVDAYRAAGGARWPLTPTDLGPSLASRLGWIRFTVDRALEARAAGATTPEAAGVPGLLTDLAHRVVVAESLGHWLG